ncbi:MAG TPA: DUF72 domain-containing protein [Spirochaetia bacterium]|nr:DUF72 domain-containing protein [Spirochaetia bacterium]
MAEILIGCSGYDYSEWRNVFYPETLLRADFLTFYASQFRTVELNFTYYKMPTEKQLADMLKRSCGNLDFSIKAHESMTHTIDPASWKDSAKAFKEALVPLQRADRLGTVLLQFPQSFHYEPDRRRYLDSLLKEMHGLPLAVEFRNAGWQNPRVFEALRERNVALSSIDMPDIPSAPPSTDVVTSDIAYVRFHGRNADSWWGSGAAERYNYLYTDEELSAWVARISSMKDQVKIIRVYFNNHAKGKAVVNAKRLQKLLFPVEGSCA